MATSEKEKVEVISSEDMLYNIKESDKKAKELKQEIQLKLEEKLRCKTCNMENIRCLKCTGEGPTCSQGEGGGEGDPEMGKRPPLQQEVKREQKMSTLCLKN